MYRVYYVDENPQQRDLYARLLQSDGLEINAIEPQASLDYLEDVSERADAVLIDFDLTADDPSIRYKGATVAIQLRTLRSDLPLILLSGVLGSESQQVPLEVSREQYDAVIDKALVSSGDASAPIAQVFGITRGYAEIRTILEHESDLGAAAAAMLGLTRDQSGSVARLQQAMAVSEPGLRVHAAAAHVLHTLGRLPFPLVSKREAAYRLGLSFEDGDALDAELSSARYAGVLRDAEPLCGRFWVSLLPEGASTEGLPEAECGVCHEKAGAMCYRCHEPFDVRHTLGLELPGAPTGMGNVRICPYCLQATLPAELTIPARLKDVAESLIAQAKAASDCDAN